MSGDLLPARFNCDFFGGTRIYRPSFTSELAMRQEAEASLRSQFKSGTYVESNEINEFLQQHFRFYDERLKQLVPQIASRHVMEFVLTQYDLSVEVERKCGRGQVIDLEELAKWRELGPIFRRATKYLAECIAMLSPDETPDAEPGQLVELTDRCWICAEQMVLLSMLSSQTFTLFPDQTILEIRPEGEMEWYSLRLDDPSRFEAFDERRRRDTASRNKVIDEMSLINNEDRLKEVLDNRFKESCGFSMTNVLHFAFSLNKHTVQPEPGFDIPFLEERQILESFRSGLGGTAEEAKRMFDGLALRRETMRKEGRVVWKPKQEYRAYTRPFFEFPHPTGTHFIWSRRMAEECLMMLYTRLVQKHIPSEWAIGTVPKAMEDYAASITKEFETTVIACLEDLEITAGRFKSSIGQGADALKIPDSIGELDVLGYWEKEELLIVGECKLVKPAHEPAMFRDDIAKFTCGRKSYVAQIQRKTEWVTDNAQQVGRALESLKDFPNTISVRRVAPVLVTYYPAFASLFISDVPCVALTELVADVRRSGVWPYTQVHDVAR